MSTAVPLIVLVLGLLGAVLWHVARRPVNAQERNMPATIGEDAIRARALALRDQLDRVPFGEDLARDVWGALMARPVGEGLVHSFHRDFCGQGLIRTVEGVKLCDIQDGGYLTGPPIAAWQSEEPFITFFARQTDFTCSGWDAAEPVFASDDEWYRGNQRLTRELLERFVRPE